MNAQSVSVRSPSQPHSSTLKISAEDIDQLVSDQVLQFVEGQNRAWQTALGAGVGFDKFAQTLNVVCLSGADAVSQANRLINAGEA